MWFAFALGAGIFYTIQGLLTRHILKGKQDSWAFSFFFSFVGALTTLPLLLFNLQYSSDIKIWAILVLVGALIVLQNLLSFKSTNYLEASIQGSIAKFRLLWVLVIGVIFFHESLTLAKLIGNLLTIAAGIIVYGKTKKIESKQGLVLAFSATIVYAIVIGFYKLLFNDFNSITLTFFIFLIPAVINLFIMPQAKERIINMAQHKGKKVFVATFFGALANLSMNHALSIGDASKVLVIIESFLIIVFVGELTILKEKDHAINKLIAVILATIGAILIRLAN